MLIKEKTKNLIVMRINNLIDQHNKKLIDKAKRHGLKLWKRDLLTPYKVAKQGDFHVSTINSILNGANKDPKFSTIENICLGLGITIQEFFNDELFDNK